MPEPRLFNCPTCETLYKVVRAEAPSASDKQLLCLSCGGPLRNREGKYALKYFRTNGPGAKRGHGRRPKLI
jgi:hypothetical protein